jgi:hypothetical protein
MGYEFAVFLYFVDRHDHGNPDVFDRISRGTAFPQFPKPE